MRLHWPLINITFMFLLPVIAARYILNNRDLHSLSTVQHGAFIQPSHQLQLSNVQYLAGSYYLNKWTIVYVQPAGCNAACIASKQMLKNLYMALGADKDRIAVITVPYVANIAAREILILDPQARAILHYSGIVDYSGLLKDMRRLLKNSHA